MENFQWFFVGKVPKQFLRTNTAYCQDYVRTIGVGTGSFQGVITDRTSKPDSVVTTIDGTVRVTSVSDDIRQDALNFWTFNKILGWGGCALGAAGVVASLFGRPNGETYSSLGSPSQKQESSRNGDFGVYGIGAGLALGVLSAFRVWSASGHKEDWADPVPLASSDRKQYGLNSPSTEKLNRLVSSNAKQRILTVEECRAIHLQAIDAYNHQLADATYAPDVERTRCVEAFLQNPNIDSSTLAYLNYENCHDVAKRAEALRSKFVLSCELLNSQCQNANLHGSLVKRDLDKLTDDRHQVLTSFVAGAAAAALEKKPKAEYTCRVCSLHTDALRLISEFRKTQSSSSS